jgi:hypothetical protein
MRVFIPCVLATQITSLTILKSEVCGLGDEPRVYQDVSTRLDKLYEESEINILLAPITHQKLWVEALSLSPRATATEDNIRGLHASYSLPGKSSNSGKRLSLPSLQHKIMTAWKSPWTRTGRDLSSSRSSDGTRGWVASTTNRPQTPSWACHTSLPTHSWKNSGFPRDE